jgi:hypothetical protein
LIRLQISGRLHNCFGQASAGFVLDLHLVHICDTEENPEGGGLVFRATYCRIPSCQETAMVQQWKSADTFQPNRCPALAKSFLLLASGVIALAGALRRRLF